VDADQPQVLAGIFLGKITKWDDPLPTKTNLDAKLPNHDIVVAFRSDGSGTTYIWTDYLAKVGEEWNSDVGFGTTVPWPVGIAGRGEWRCCCYRETNAIFDWVC
jgi:phosphate transport system substrate-binding protein